MATGSTLGVAGAAASPVQFTYSLLMPVFPGYAGVTVTLRTRGNGLLASCSFGFLVGAACQQFGPAVAPGTPLICSATVYSFAGGGTYACAA